jgi:hypothetical protein
MSLRDSIEERYPDMLPLLGIPEIRNLLTLAVAQHWPPATFRSHFIASHWFRSMPEAGRRYWVTSATDPGEAKRMQSSMAAQVRQAAMQFGANLSNNQIAFLARSMLLHGQDASGPELQAALAKLWNYKMRGHGAVGAARGQVQNLYGSYLIGTASAKDPNSIHTLDRKALDIARGADTIEALEERLRLQAMRRYPWMADMIAKGMTPGEVVRPLQQTIANELELANPDQVDVMHDPKYRSLLGIHDPKNNKMRMMTESEAMRLARSQTAWWKTSAGRQTDAQSASAMLQKFGIRA